MGCRNDGIKLVLVLIFSLALLCGCKGGSDKENSDLESSHSIETKEPEILFVDKNLVYETVSIGVEVAIDSAGILAGNGEYVYVFGNTRTGVSAGYDYQAQIYCYSTKQNILTTSGPGD